MTRINNKGSTLIEAVIASAVIGIGFAGLIYLFTYSINLQKQSGKKNQMMTAAKGIAEYTLYGQDFTLLSEIADGQPRDVSNMLDTFYQTKFKAQRTINYVDSTNNHLLRVVIEVVSIRDDSYSNSEIIVVFKSYG